MPDAPPAGPVPAPRALAVDVVVVGGGPAGLAAADALVAAADGLRVLLIDEQAELGGSWRAEPDGLVYARTIGARLRARGVRILPRATAIGYFPEDRLPAVEPSAPAPAAAAAVDRAAPAGLLAVASATEGLFKISARRFLYATGSADQNLPFPDNDRPGIISARACGRLAFRHGVRAGRRIAIVGDEAYGDRLATGLMAAGISPSELTRIPDSRAIHGVAGATRLRGLTLGAVAGAGAGAGAGGRTHLPVDAIAVAARPAPASELPRQHGAEVVFDLARGGFATIIDAEFGTTVPGVLACGDVTGYVGPAQAEAAGRAAGALLGRALGRAPGRMPGHGQIPKGATPRP